MIEWFDDLALGMRFRSGEAKVTAEDIKRFAAEYDPQPFHLDEAAAANSVFKGLAASGWHTAAISMRLCVEARPFGPQPLLGLGVDELRWMMPVRPGDVLHVEGEVVELIPSRTKPQGIAKVKWTAYNQRGEAVSASESAESPPHPDSPQAGEGEVIRRFNLNSNAACRSDRAARTRARKS
jgi:acyl dehydratase